MINYNEYSYFQALACDRLTTIFEEDNYAIINFMHNDVISHDEANIYCLTNYYGYTLPTQIDYDDDFELQIDMMDEEKGVYEIRAWIGLNYINTKYSWEVLMYSNNLLDIMHMVIEIVVIGMDHQVLKTISYSKVVYLWTAMLS